MSEQRSRHRSEDELEHVVPTLEPQEPSLQHGLQLHHGALQPAGVAGRVAGVRAGKKCGLVDKIGARLGSEANLGSHKMKISS